MEVVTIKTMGVLGYPKEEPVSLETALKDGIRHAGDYEEFRASLAGYISAPRIIAARIGGFEDDLQIVELFMEFDVDAKYEANAMELVRALADELEDIWPISFIDWTLPEDALRAK